MADAYRKPAPYNSENSTILTTDENGHMFLAKRTCDGRVEFVIGSNFKQHYYEGFGGYARTDYEWVWGHYFFNIVEAVEFWKNEVMGVENVSDTFSATLNSKRWEFDRYMTYGKWDELSPDGIYKDDANYVLGAFVEFCMTGKVTNYDEDYDDD